MFYSSLVLNSFICYWVAIASKPPTTASKNGSTTDAQNKILKELSWTLKLALLKHQHSNSSKGECANAVCSVSKDGRDSRRVGVQALEMPARRLELTDLEADDNNMKMKLFRLMYENVRESDLKVKRAELIKKSYANSTSFEVGYLLGDVTDKYNIMKDISNTLQRLYHEWKPIEHINAYEQLANLALDLGHLTDSIKNLDKKYAKDDDDDSDGRHKDDDRNKKKGNGTTLPGYFQIN